MGCVQWLSAVLVYMLMASLVAGDGMLYPTESESRVIHSLDGIWAFRIANQSDSSVGHREGWYKQELRKVSDLLFLFSLLFFICLCTCIYVNQPIGTRIRTSGSSPLVSSLSFFLSASSSSSLFSCFILLPSIILSIFSSLLLHLIVFFSFSFICFLLR
jgi:hypothetical protein